MNKLNNPDKTDLFVKISNLLYQGKQKDAVKILENLFKQTKEICYLNEIVKIYQQEKDYKALIKTRKKIEKVHNTLSNIKNLAYYNFIIGKYKDALKYYLQVLECEGSTAENDFNVGCCYYLLKKTKKAEEYYKYALGKNPNHVQTLNNLSIIYYENGNWQDAVKILKRALVISPLNAETFHHLGIIFRNFVRDYELSELYLKKAIYYDEQHAENYYQIALTYMAENKYQKAFADLQECINRNSQDKKAKKLFKNIQKFLK